MDNEAVGELYQSRGYPPMSHPSTDPAATVVAAWFSGLRPPDPATARILEIGCASGQNLLPLAVRWPGAICTGADISEDAIAQARRRAVEAGIRNATFVVADLRDLELSGQEFDFIIAHGVFSWVADDAKKALLELCARHLSPSGTAVISFNVWAGWEKRQPVVAAARRIMEEHGAERMKALAILREVMKEYADIIAIIDDMLAKGDDILAFDDFGPVNDPWPLEDFAAAAVSCGLRWLGDSNPAENVPSSLDDASRESLVSLVGDPLRMQMTADAMAQRTFRSGLLCRADAPISPRMTGGMVMELAVRANEVRSSTISPLLKEFLNALTSFHPDSVPVAEVLEQMGMTDFPAAAKMVFQAITRGDLHARSEPVRVSKAMEHPRLDSFRLICARERIPLVDAWHVPCLFTDKIWPLLVEIDGRKTRDELAALARKLCPDLAFPVWLKHLEDRGMFC
jgi:SAM-dependent methyltransferase